MGNQGHYALIAMSTKMNPIAWVLIGLIMVVLIFTGIGSYLFGKKQAEDQYKREAVKADRTLDSLYTVELRLRGSLDSLSKIRADITRVRTVYKTYYDTVQVKIVTVEILDGLNKILNTPLPNEQ